MKKKEIEGIPYLKLTALSQKKEAKYIGVTALKTVGHEQHFFLEVYRNEENARDIPVVRIVTTKKDFGSYFPEEEKWTRQKIQPGGKCEKLIWYSREDSGEYSRMPEKNILQGEEDLARLKAFYKVALRNEKRWWEYILKQQENIVWTTRRNAEQRKYERRQEALNERIRNTKKLPEKAILKRAEKTSLGKIHYLYYKKHGSRVQIACSKCGGVIDARWKPGESYESQIQSYIAEPKENRTGTCPMCGIQGIYKCQGKVKGSHGKSMYMFLGQKYKEKGMVVRYLKIEKDWHLELYSGDKRQKMHGAYEELSGVEVARVFFEPGKEIQKDYHKHSWCSGEDFWDDCNLYGMANITINAAPVMEETFEEIKGTIFQYSALKEYAAAVENIDPVRYLKKYQEMPQIEFIAKAGMTGVIQRLLNNNESIIKNKNAKNIDGFLGIRKERVKYLASRNGNLDLLKAMQAERTLQKTWTEEQLEQLAEAHMDRGRIETAIQYMGIQKLLNRIKKYAGCEYGTGCEAAGERIRQTAITYTDYLGMRFSLGYDLNNTVYQYPRDLQAEHDRMTYEMNKEKMDRRFEEVKRAYPDIRKNYRDLWERYFYEDDIYLIRPARSAEEIVAEGRILHHCVGRDCYLKKHNDGNSFILMLRFKDRAETPYITVEIDGSKPHIMQWYGSHDRKPDAKNIQKWLDQYIARLKKKRSLLAKTA